MPKNTDLFLTAVENCQISKIVNADAANSKKLIFTAGANGSIVRYIIVTMDDTAARTGQLWAYDGANYALLGTFSIAGQAGNTATILPVSILDYIYNSIEVFKRVAQAGNKILGLKAGWSLYWSNTAQVTNLKTQYITVLGEDF